MADVLSKEERKNQINKMTKKEIDANIRELKKQIKEINAQIKEKETKKAQLTEGNSKRVSKLEAAHNKDIEALNAEKKALEEEMAAFNKEVEESRLKEKQKQEETEKKKKELTERHKEVIEEEKSLNKKKHEEEVKKENKKLDELRASKKKQNETYNESATKLDASYRKVKDELNEQNAKLKEKKEKLESDARQEIDSLEKEKIDLNAANKSELARIDEENSAELFGFEEAQDMALNQKRAELNTLYQKLAEANDKKSIAQDDYDQTLSRLESEYNDLANKYDVERASLNQRNESLRREMEIRREENEKQRLAASEQYKQSLQDLNDLIADYGDKEAISAASLKHVLEQQDEEYKKKYSQLVDYLDEQYLQEKMAQEKEIEDLKYRIALEQEELSNRNAYLKERYENREAEYKRTNEKLVRDNDELENRITELENTYTARINDLKADLLTIKNDHESAIEAKKQELARMIEEVRVNKAAYKEKIDEEKDDVSRQITKIDNDILRIREELSEFMANAKVKENALKVRHEDMVAGILNEKDKIDVLRRQLEDKIAQDVKEREALMEELKVKRQGIDDQYQNELIEIEGLHTAQMVDLKNKQEDLIEATNKDHEDLLNELTMKFRETKKELEEEGQQRKIEFDEAKARLLKQTQDLEDDNEARINTIHARKSDLLNQIQALKENLESETVKYNEDKDELDRIRNNTINDLEAAFRAQVEEINADTTPVDEFQEIKNIFTGKSLEYENLVKDAEEQKALIEKEISDYVKRNDQEKLKVEEELAAATRNYEDRQRSADEEYENFKKELSDEEEKLAEYRSDLERQLNDIRQRGESEMSQLMEKQNEEYAQLSDSYRSKEGSVQSVYDQEIKYLSDELEAKKTDYNNHLEDIRRRKAKREYDYDVRYNNELVKTEALQKEVNDANELLETKRKEWSDELEARKSEYDEEINGIRSSHSSIISENKRAFDEKAQNLKKRSQEIREEIRKIEEESHKRRNELEAYKISRSQEYDELKVATNDHLNEINRKLNEICEKETELENMHNIRVIEIKKQIAKALSESESLDRTIPFMAKREEERVNDEIVGKTAEFKSKLDNLDKTHKDILDRLSKYKDDALKKIDEEMVDLMNNDKSLENDFEKEFEEIANTYDRLIAKEKAKHGELLESIEISNGLLNSEQLLFDNEAAKYDLSDIYKARIDEMDRDINGLENERNTVLEGLNDLIRNFDAIDDEIDAKKSELLRIFRTKAREIDEYYEKAIEENRSQYRNIDIMNDDVSSIFKKRS